MIAKIFNILVFIVCSLTVYSLFVVKNKVRVLNSQITELSKQVEEERDKIHILKAEFGFLTLPERLKNLSSNLGLTDITIDQMIKDPLIDNQKNEVLNYISANNQIKHRVKWRYKKAPNNSRYTQVSHHAK